MNRARIVALAVVVAMLSGGTAMEFVSEATGCDDMSTAEIRNGELLCIHNDQKPPPGVDARKRPSLDELRGRRLGHARNAGVAETDDATIASVTAAEAEAGYQVKCIGDGVAGNRVQAVYAVATDKSDRSAGVIPMIRQYAADADLRINRSASTHGEGRRIRFVTVPLPEGACQVDVRVVRLSPTGDDTFANMRSELRAQGLSRSDRKYLVWVDAAVGICGLGEIYNNDKPTADNPNNRGPMYARTDAPCWGYGEAHELLHNLGAVQRTAPNATAGGHCVDTNDVMCYSDGPGVTMTSRCPDLPPQHVDCRLDDYFAPKPASGAYLDRHWNVATSSFLEPDDPPPPAPKVTVSAPSTMLAGGTAPVQANLKLPSNRTASLTWSASRKDCRFASAARLSTTLACPATAAGTFEVTASIVDNLGMAASNLRDVAFSKPSRPRGTALSLGVSSSRVVFGSAVRVSGRLTDAATGKGVFGMPVAIFALANGASSYRQKGSGVTDVNGKVTAMIRLSQSSKVVMTSSGTATWRQATSRGRAVAVAYRVDASQSASRVKRGRAVRVTARVNPADSGIPVRLVRVTSGGTRLIKSRTLSGTGRVTFSYTPTTSGKQSLRVLVPATTQRAGGQSARLSLRVR